MTTVNGFYLYFYQINHFNGRFTWKQIEGIDVIVDNKIYINKEWVRNDLSEEMGVTQYPVLLLED